MLLSADSTKACVTMDNREFPITIDLPECFPDPEQTITKQEYIEHVVISLANKATTTWVELNYERFDVFIELGYYDRNENDLIEFFNDFEIRFNLLESLTGWNSEDAFGHKLIINVTEAPLGVCAGGQFWPGVDSYVDLRLADPIHDPTYSCSWERDMEILIHESTHAISPLHIYYGRYWIREGWASYFEYDVLVRYGDITQSLADTEIFQGTNQYNWTGYVDNDYHDTSVDESEIQWSLGYDIVAWMFTMLRNDYNLDWNSFYNIYNSNEETLEKSLTFGWYMVDTVILDIFTRSSNAEISTFQYDEPEGPGWGVRHLEPLDWYADLVAELPNSDTTLMEGELLPVVIRNDGGVSLVSVPVILYADSDLIWVDTVDVADSSSLTLYVDLGLADGTYTVSLIVDEDNLKIESDETNNSNSVQVIIGCCLPPIRGNVDYDPGDAVDISDLVYLVDYMFNSGPEPPCLSESDIDASGGESPIDISDLVYLVDYMFTGGPAPAACP